MEEVREDSQACTQAPDGRHVWAAISTDAVTLGEDTTVYTYTRQCCMCQEKQALTGEMWETV